jgi:phosphoribosylformylglycinamidine cyclo-ligase
LVYSGSKQLTEKINIDGFGSITVGRLILSPTRTYAPVVKQLLNEMRSEIHGMVHCSGGAQTKVLHFVNDDVHIIKDNMLLIPPLFQLIQAESGTSWQEMYKVFNMGHRLEIYLPEAQAQRVIDVAKSFKINAQVIGRVEQSSVKKLTIESEMGKFTY